MKFSRPLFALLLLLSGLVTAFLGARTLLDAEGMMETFGVTAAGAEGLELLIAVLGSVLLSLALIVLLAAWWSWRDLSAGRTLGLVCAATLLLVAICAFVIGGSTEILLLDGIRGLVLFALGLTWKPSAEQSN